jgi:hypothetical protein
MRDRTSAYSPRNLEDIEREPTFEDEIECGAKFLRTRIEWMNRSGLPFAGFIISREFAGALAGWLEQCARDRRREAGE